MEDNERVPLGGSCDRRWQYSMCEMVGVEVMNFEVKCCPKLFSDLSASRLYRLLGSILAKDATEVITVVAIEMFGSILHHSRSEET